MVKFVMFSTSKKWNSMKKCLGVELNGKIIHYFRRQWQLTLHLGDKRQQTLVAYKIILVLARNSRLVSKAPVKKRKKCMQSYSKLFSTNKMDFSVDVIRAELSCFRIFLPEKLWKNSMIRENSTKGAWLTFEFLYKSTNSKVSGMKYKKKDRNLLYFTNST